jgi:hypothetical protein
MPEKYVLTDETWARHCAKNERISNSAVRPDKSKSMLAAMIDNEGNFEKTTTGDGKNVVEFLRSLS